MNPEIEILKLIEQEKNLPRIFAEETIRTHILSLKEKGLIKRSDGKSENVGNGVNGMGYPFALTEKGMDLLSNKKLD